MKMEQVNLFPPEIMIRRRQATLIQRAVIGVVALCLLITGLLGMQRVQLSGLRAEQEHVIETMAANKEMESRIAAAKKEQKALEARAAILLNAMDSPRWGKILFELSTIVPTDVWIQSLAFTPQERTPVIVSAVAPGSNSIAPVPDGVSYDYGEIRIQGGGADAQSVSRFIEELSKSVHFDNVTPVVTETPGRGRPASYTLVGRLLF